MLIAGRAPGQELSTKHVRSPLSGKHEHPVSFFTMPTNRDDCCEYCHSLAQISGYIDPTGPGLTKAMLGYKATPLRGSGQA